MPFDEFIATQERRLSSAAVLIENTKGELLVLKASYKPYWSTPSGIVDAEESPTQAAVREVREETSLTIRPADLDFASIIYRHSKQASTYLFVFRLLYQVDETSLNIQVDGGEITDFDWVSKDDVLQKIRGSYNTAIKNWAHNVTDTYIERMIQ